MVSPVMVKGVQEVKTSKDTKQPKTTLSRIQARALPILLSASSVAQGCRLAGISRDRYYDWMRLPEFKETYDTQSRELVRESFRSMKLLAGQSIEILGRLLNSRNENVRLKTVTLIIESLTRIIDQEEILPRLSELEKIVEDEGRTK